ncbi:DctP family TRAP transporter solute-binding subunit [Synergistaceae bacterium OttesenSCG-928-I11]|nr:DctP family TRAP transporter solute-binding subunit [Synergistaceae bacterium OttesenSCG-928-I11]
MKRFATLALVMMLAVLMSVSVADAAAKYRIKIHSVGSDTHPSTPALHEFKKFVEEKSNGQIEVGLHINAALGGDREAIEAMQLGTVEAGIVGTSIIATFEPKFNIFEFPFLFKNHEIATRFLDGEYGEMLNKELQKQDVRIIGYGVNGFRNISNNRGPIHKPEDLNGLKIRTMENPIHIATFKLMGANPTPMNFGELYTALSQKTVDAQENPINLTYTSKFYEVQKFYSLTGHLYAVAPLAMSEIFFKRLPDDLKEVVLEGGRLYTKIERANTIDEENNMLTELKAKGMQINELSDEEKDVFKKATEPVYKEFESRVGKELLEAALKVNQ